MPVRALLLALLLLVLAVPAPASAQDRTTRTWTLAGGGVLTPATGVQASLARLDPADLTVLPDGRVVLVQRGGSPRTRNVFAIEADGTLRLLGGAAGGRRATSAWAQPDGTLLVTSAGSTVDRLDPATGDAVPVADLAAAPGFTGRGGGLQEAIRLTDGTLVAGDGSSVWRVDAAGAIARAYPAGPDAPSLPQALTPLPGGAFALANRNRTDVVRVAPDGALAVVGQIGFADPDLATLPDGALLLADPGTSTLRRIDPAGGGEEVLGGASPGIGDGDGELLAAIRTDPQHVAAGPDGLRYVAEADGRIRALTTDAALPAFVALTPRGHATLRAGTAEIRASRPGTVTVTVTRRGRTLASGTARVPAGLSEVALGARLRGRDALRVRVSLAHATGRRAIDRATADTRRALPRTEAVRLLDRQLAEDGGGDDQTSYGSERGRCVRRSATRIDCLVLAYEIERGSGGPVKTTRCTGRARIRLRPDGVGIERVPGCPRS